MNTGYVPSMFFKKYKTNQKKLGQKNKQHILSYLDVSVILLFRNAFRMRHSNAAFGTLIHKYNVNNEFMNCWNSSTRFTFYWQFYSNRVFKFITVSQNVMESYKLVMAQGLFYWVNNPLPVFSEWSLIRATWHFVYYCF